MQQMRRVRTVRLAAPEEALVRRGATLLEDALRVASLPGTDGGRMLLIRSLHLGRINVLQPSTSTSLTIEERVRTLSSGAVHAEDPAASGARAVYFRDETEPFILLATRIALQASTDTWFWPLAVPAWRHDMGRDEALRAVLYGSAETRVGKAAAVALIGELHRRRVIEPLLAALRWTDGHHLMRMCGWRELPPGFVRAVPRATTLAEVISPLWTQTLRRWAGQWGATDARTLWLAAVALSDEKPARLLDDRLLARAGRVLHGVMVTSGPRDEVDAMRPAVPASQADAPGKADIERGGADVYDGVYDGVYKELSDSEARNRDEDRSPASRPDGPESRQPSDRHPTDHTIYPGGATGIELADRRTGEWSTGIPWEPDIIADVPPPLEVGERARRTWLESRPTAYAGLFLLIPAMSRLGMTDMVAAYPDLLELDLPDRILREVGRRSGVPIDDPVMAVSSTMWPCRTLRVREFVVPDRWLPALSHEGTPRLRRGRGHAHRRVLYDASGRLPLALWQGRAPEAARGLLAGSGMRRDPHIVRKAGIALVLDAWLVALRRWCRLYGELSLREIVRRPGEISITHTHLDVLFDVRSVDIRIRKAGLDLNPGWIPWFGRVVSFHYRSGEDADGID